MRITPLTTRRAARIVGLGLLAGLAISAASAAAAAPAFAHDTVVSSSPYNGETVTTPIDTVTVSFSDELLALSADASGFAIQITDADGGHHESGCVTVDGSDASTGVALGEAGEYDVTWQVVSGDGHPISGRYSFTWQPTAVTVAAPAWNTAPACGAAWSGQPAVVSSTGTPTPGSAAYDPTGSATLAPGEAATVDPGAAADVPEPTMTILSAVPADASNDSGLALPLAIVVGVGSLVALSAVLFAVVRRARGDRPTP